MKCQYQFRKDLKGYILFFLIDIDEWLRSQLCMYIYTKISHSTI